MWEKSRKMKNFSKSTLLAQGIILLVILSGYAVPKQKKNKSEPQYKGEISVS